MSTSSCSDLLAQSSHCGLLGSCLGAGADGHADGPTALAGTSRNGETSHNQACPRLSGKAIPMSACWPVPKHRALAGAHNRIQDPEGANFPFKHMDIKSFRSDSEVHRHT